MGYLLGASGGVDNAYPIRLFGRDEAKGEVDLLMIAFRSSANAVAFLIVSLAGARPSFRQCEDQRPIGKEVAAGETVQFPNSLDPEAEGSALVGQRGIQEAIAQHPVTPFQRRTNSFLDVIRAGRREEQGLGF